MEYTLNVMETKKDSLSISVYSNSFCMEQDEDAGFAEINKKLYDMSEFPKETEPMMTDDRKREILRNWMIIVVEIDKFEIYSIDW